MARLYLNMNLLKLTLLQEKISSQRTCFSFKKKFRKKKYLTSIK
jgi:hypothetical protein